MNYDICSSLLYQDNLNVSCAYCGRTPDPDSDNFLFDCFTEIEEEDDLKYNYKMDRDAAIDEGVIQNIKAIKIPFASGSLLQMMVKSPANTNYGIPDQPLILELLTDGAINIIQNNKYEVSSEPYIINITILCDNILGD